MALDHLPPEMLNDIVDILHYDPDTLEQYCLALG